MDKITMDTGMTPLDIYGQINNHMITALMFHDQMADLYDFLNLHGFKRLHEYQHIAESMERRKLKRYVLNHHNHLLMDANIENPKVIPAEWYDYSRFDVTPQVRKQSLKKSFDRYRDWETHTKEMYCSCMKQFQGMGNMADSIKVSELLKDVDMELKTLERLHLELESVEYDIDYVMTLQKPYHDKYKCMLEKLTI